MRVLDPIRRNAEEMEDLQERYSDMIDLTLENLEMYGGAILNNRHDILDEEDEFFFLLWRDDSVMDIDSIEELESEKESLKELNKAIFAGVLETKFAKSFANDKEDEPNYDKPIESYKTLENIKEDLQGLNQRIEKKIIQKYDIDPELIETNFDTFDYSLNQAFFSLSDNIDALPVIEALVESEENIKREKENLLSKAVDEHREHKESVKNKYNRTQLNTDPIDWKELIQEQDLSDFMDVSEIQGVTHGDTLHIMMEEICQQLDSVESEYSLHFTNKGDERDTPINDRIDNTVRPDAVDDLLVYEFKHMPYEQKLNLQEQGELERDKKFMESVEQLNGYLNDLDLPAGVLVYVSSDMEVKEYVLEKHNNGYAQDTEIEKFLHNKEEYEFDKIPRNL